MASIFLSYARSDAVKAEQIAQSLEAAGHSVWWDHEIHAGSRFSIEIEEALSEADIVVVLWSATSIKSAWVHDEAAAGRDSGKLVPVLIDGVQPPLGFRQYQAVNLKGKSRGGMPALRPLIDAVAGKAGNGAAIKSVTKQPSRWPQLGWRIPAIVGGMTLLLVVIGIFWMRPWTSKATVPIVEIVAAEQSNSTRELARDLLIKLGNLRSNRPDAMKLVEGGRRKEAPNFIFEIGNSVEGRQSTTSLALLDGRDSGLLWSKDFQQPSNNQAELKLQVAFTAARVLECALEGLIPSDRRLRIETLKLYLNACSQLPDIADSDPRPVIPVFLQVIRDAPEFKPAWAKLLQAEATAAEIWFNNGVLNVRARNVLRQHIDAARKLDPTMPEATLAEISLLPTGAFAQAISMIDRAKQRTPDNPLVLSFRGGLLQKVGRMRESVEDNQRAADLEPLSPAMRYAYISALAHAGRLDSAQEELRRAEQLWPETDTLRVAQYGFYLRYGDPKVALRMLQSEGGSAGGIELYLKARIEPTPENVDRMIAYTQKRLPSAGVSGLGVVIQSYAEFDRQEELFRLVMNWRPEKELSLLTDVFFRPALRKFRRDPRFMQVARRSGLLDYWRSSGDWPDFCIEPSLPYDCKIEAAKISA